MSEERTKIIGWIVFILGIVGLLVGLILVNVATIIISFLLGCVGFFVILVTADLAVPTRTSTPAVAPTNIDKEALQKKRQELAEQGIVSCPRCGSTSIAGVRSGPDTTVDGYSWARELTGGCTVVNVCQVCGHRFYPGV